MSLCRVGEGIYPAKAFETVGYCRAGGEGQSTLFRSVNKISLSLNIFYCDISIHMSHTQPNAKIGLIFLKC